MKETDKRNKLDDEPFDFKIFKNKVQIFWNGKPVMMIKEPESQNLIRKIENCKGKEIQLVLAKVTGNFKRGNENKSKNK